MNNLSTFKKMMAMSALLSFATVGIAAADINIPSGVGLNKNMYFQTPGGDPVEIKAGIYEVAKGQEWLKLTPVGGERYDSVLIDAKEATHDEELTTEKAFLMPSSEERPDLQNLLLYLPAGTAYEATGSHTGVFTRGFGSWVKGAAKKVGGAAKSTVKRAGRTAKRVGQGAVKAGKFVGKTGYRAGRLGVNTALYAPKGVLRAAGSVGRQVYRGGKLIRTAANAFISLPKMAVGKAVGQACATVKPSSRKACEKVVARALDGIRIP